MSDPIRVYKMTQHLVNPGTGEPLYSVQQLQEALARRTIKGWAWVLHDQDVGGDHVAAVFWTHREVPPGKLAEWFGVPPQHVERVRGGRAGLVDEVRYLTHEDDAQQALGKVRYPDSAVQASPGWDWRAEVDDVMARRLASGSNRQRSRSVEAAVGQGLSVRQARLRGGSVEGRLRRLRAAYLAAASPPPLRIVYYMFGGDDLGCEALGRGLATTLANNDPAGVFLGGGTYDHYDGEPVIFWPGVSPMDLVGGLRAADLFSLLRPLPEPRLRDTRYGPSQLVHEHLVITGSADADQFRRVLEQLYRQISSDARRDSYLHLPVVIPVSAESLAVQVNSGVLGEGAFDQYRELGSFRLAMAGAMDRVRLIPQPERTELEGRIVARQVAPILVAGAMVRGQLAPPPPDDLEAILAPIGERMAGSEPGTD